MTEPSATPQSTGQLLLAGIHLFRTGFREVLGILLTQTITILVLFVVLFSLTVSLYDSTSANRFQFDFIASLILSSLFILAVQLGFIASFTAKFWAHIHNTQMTTAHAYAVGIRKALPLLIWLLAYVAIVSTGLLLLFVPGLILMVTLFMGGPLVIQDHYSTLAAIKASHKLVWPSLRQTLLYLVTAALITTVAYFVTIFPLGMFIAYLTNHNPMLSGVISLVRYALIVMLAPLFVALVIPYYMCLLRRQQGK